MRRPALLARPHREAGRRLLCYFKCDTADQGSVPAYTAQKKQRFSCSVWKWKWDGER